MDPEKQEPELAPQEEGGVTKSKLQIKIEGATSSADLFEMIRAYVVENDGDMEKLKEKINKTFSYEDRAGGMDRSSISGLEQLRNEDLSAELQKTDKVQGLTKQEFEALMQVLPGLRKKESEKINQEKAYRKSEELNAGLREIRRITEEDEVKRRLERKLADREDFDGEADAQV